MKNRLIALLGSALLGLTLSLGAQAETPRVVASLAPLHSLAASVMADVAEPELLLPAGASPHAYSLRPSEAERLRRADLVIWVGPELERFLERPLRTLAADAERMALIKLDGLTLLDTREGGQWDAHHDHDHDHDHGHGHGHGHGHEHNHGDKHEHSKSHGHSHEDDAHHHHHRDYDTHLWLSPAFARQFVTALAERLAAMDPDHGEVYRANAAAAIERIDRLDESLRTRLAPLADTPYLVFHDAYQYFEAHYGLSPVGSVTVSPERQPSARRLSELRQRIRDTGARCVFAEPQFRPSIVNTLVTDTEAEAGVLDPLGAELEPGHDAWFQLMENLANDLEGCLARQ